MKNENRKWVEQLAVTIVRAVNVSGIPQTQTVLYSRLWLRPGMPWTISALAEATSLDRASVCAHLKNFPEHHLVRTDDGFVLTPAGERHTYRLTLQFYRAIETKDRHKMKGFFSTKYAGQSPMRKQGNLWWTLISAPAAFRIRSRIALC
ncbi:MAG: hypothetical protein P8Q50_14570 [Octadecabacter sp.]|nr:hypothetical protein [Octadecabacter sp.]